MLSAGRQYMFNKTCSASQRGFTLLELLVVMVIIGLLSAYVGPKVFGQIGKSETKIAKAQIEAIVKGLEQYRIDAGHYPSADQGLAALMVAPAGEAKWAGPYMAKALPPRVRHQIPFSPVFYPSPLMKSST